MRIALLAAALLTVQASGAQDLDIQFRFAPEAYAEVDSVLLGSPGVVQAYELDLDGDGWTERLLLSFTPRSEETVHASLNNFVAETQRVFLERLPDRAVRSIGIDLETHPLSEAGLPFSAFGFFRPVPEGTIAPPVCDSAALFFESEAGFWTLSWNAPRGWLRGELNAVFALLDDMVITPLAPEAPALAEVRRDAAPLSIDVSRLARVRPSDEGR
ncbi:MAG: hypothetical protein AAFQ43_00005 [Bacteroidota bacterium]